MDQGRCWYLRLAHSPPGRPQSRMRDAWDSADVERSGALLVRDLACFVSALMSAPTDAEVAYFQARHAPPCHAGDHVITHYSQSFTSHSLFISHYSSLISHSLS